MSVTTFEWDNNDYVLYEDYQKLEQRLIAFTPKPYWTTASKSLVNRLRGIYHIGPQADQGIGEFGTRTFDNMPPIQFEAAQRIEELEERIAAVLKEDVDDWILQMLRGDFEDQ